MIEKSLLLTTRLNPGKQPKVAEKQPGVAVFFMNPQICIFTFAV